MIPRSFDLVGSIDSTTISWNTVIYEFFFNLRELCTAGIAVYKFSLCFVCTDQWVSGQQCINGSPKSHYPWLKCHENEEKIEHDHVLRNDHRIKTTQPISMILVSFFSEDNVLSDEKRKKNLEYQSKKKSSILLFLGHQ